MTRSNDDVSSVARWCVRLLVAAVLVATVAATLLLPTTEPIEAATTRVSTLLFAAVGLVVTRRVEGRVIGRLLLGVAATQATFDLAVGVAARGGWGVVWAYWLGDLVSVVTPVLLLVLLPLWFPTGRPPSPRWRWVTIVTLTALGLFLANLALLPTTYEDVGSAVVASNPAAMPVSEDLIGTFEALFAVLALVGAAAGLASIASLVVRFRRSVGVERLQLRWFVSALVAIAVLLVVLLGGAAVVEPAFGVRVPEWAIDLPVGLAVCLVPAAIAVALTRHGLYEIDRVVRRTVAWTAVTLLLLGVYAGLVLGVQLAVDLEESPDLVVAGSTLAVAALVGPLRRRVQSLVDRRFNRRAADASARVAAFAGHVRDQVDLAELDGSLRSVAAAVVQPSTIQLWLRDAPSRS